MARDLPSWLADLGFGKYVEIFVANDVDLDLLPELDDGDLEQLGISFGHRKRLLRAIAELKATPQQRVAVPAGPGEGAVFRPGTQARC